MAFDLGIIEAWATALLVITDSPGVAREVEAARRKGLPVFVSVQELGEAK